MKNDLSMCGEDWPTDFEKGYILEGGLKIPQHLHDSHNYLPFIPENMIPTIGKCPKLILNLLNDMDCNSKKYTTLRIYRITTVNTLQY